ncbi:hypothetical protein WJX79_003623 [Trebouxia sp. C0005]
MPETQPNMLFAAAMPKEEIGALPFLEEQPESDGRGVIVAIFDTGVDPGAEGLQTTADGKPKILDIVDGTGSGDVGTSKTVEAEDAVIVGIHGDKMALNPAWQNPTGKWHVGVKHLYELVPAGLKKRIKEDRRKSWDEQQAACVATAWTDLGKASKAVDCSKTKDAEAKLRLKKMKEEHQTRTELLKDMTAKYEDAGPLLQCVVWHDGSHWRAAIDTSDMYEQGRDKGRLADFKPLTNYKTERQYGTFSAQDGCNFVCNIYEEGDVLSIVVDSGSHGTHVAGITAAHQPDNPSLNGIAPGAQLISCKIGDSRLGGMETGTGLTRALITVLEHKADLINMSFGEATSTPNYGRFIDLANEVVNKHGVIFVSSAGNAGPALSTVGAPGGTSSAILSIGAYVSPAMAAVAHSVRQEIAQGQQYTWSSRGPTPDGATGVVLSAPGGAIAPVPQWTEQVRQLMNGTSMSSPNACGGIALLLSAMKANHMPISPSRVRRALENTCQVIEEQKSDAVLTYGRGLLQVHKAFAYLSKSADVDQPDVRYEVKARRSDSMTTQRGILMREPRDSIKPVTFMCEVQPKLHEDAGMDKKLLVYDEVHMECTAPWLEAPHALILPHNGRNFEVQVDPVGLGEGLHYAEVQAFDSKARWRGPLFRIPVTVIKPTAIGQGTADPARPVPAAAPAIPLSVIKAPGLDEMQPSIYDTEPSADIVDAKEPAVQEGSHEQGVQAGQDFIARLGTVQFQPGTEVRRFLEVPEGATWGEMTLKAGNHATPRNFMLRATQILPHTRYSDTEARAYASLGAHARHVVNFKLTGAATLEITLSQFWSSLGAGTLEVEVAFHGVGVQGTGVIAGPSRTSKVLVRAPIRSEKINPSAKLNDFQIPLKPVESQMHPLDAARDQLPQGRTIHALLLTYKLSLEAEGKHRVTVPMLNRYVYDGEFESQMSMLHDTNKRLIKVSDIYPDYADLKKGDYTIRLQLRHDDAVLLDKMKELPVVVERKLKEAVTVPVYATNRDAVKGSKAVKERALHPGERVAYFLGPVPQDKLPKDAGPGSCLVGSLKLGLLQGSKEHAPGAFPIFYSCGPKSKPADKDDSKDSDDKDEEPKLEEAVWEAKLKFLQNMKAVKESDTDSTPEAEEEAKEVTESTAEASFTSQPAAELEEELLQNPPKGSGDKLRVLRSRLKRLGGNIKKDPQAVIGAADEAIEAVDQVALAQFVALKNPEEGPEAAKKKKEMNEVKAGLVDALTHKCRALVATLPKVGEGKDEAQEPQPSTGGNPDVQQPEEAAQEPAEGQQPQDEDAQEPAVAQSEEEEVKNGSGGDDEDEGLDPAAVQAFMAAFQELRKWVDTSEAQYAILHANYEAAQKRPALAIKTLSKASEDKAPAREVLELKAQIFEKLGWQHWHRHELSCIRLLFPTAYPLF